MNEEKRTPVYLTDAQCEILKKVLEYEDIWIQIFRIREGQAILDFDSSGKMKASVKYPLKGVVDNRT